MVISQTHYLHPYSLPHHNRPLASKQSLGKWWGPPTGLERDTEKPGELKALGYETSGEDSISAPKNLTTWLEKCSGLACGCLAVHHKTPGAEFTAGTCSVNTCFHSGWKLSYRTLATA